jgi:hypothetical protein
LISDDVHCSNNEIENSLNSELSLTLPLNRVIPQMIESGCVWEEYELLTLTIEVTSEITTHAYDSLNLFPSQSQAPFSSWSTIVSPSSTIRVSLELANQ